MVQYWRPVLCLSEQAQARASFLGPMAPQPGQDPFFKEPHWQKEQLCAPAPLEGPVRYSQTSAAISLHRRCPSAPRPEHLAPISPRCAQC